MITIMSMLYDFKEPIPDEIISMIDSFISIITYICIFSLFLPLILFFFRR